MGVLTNWPELVDMPRVKMRKWLKKDEEREHLTSQNKSRTPDLTPPIACYRPMQLHRTSAVGCLIAIKVDVD